ncbi:hypothetical protein KOM00_07460 [Geomonas sp. Red69]|uniref:DUF1858 domain-containing protein n=1 Tax=Geomonas diazotrophica TaxID=2843197 RepID=A0ABX8JJS4_9BACT|nr:MULTISPECIES: hypothetical protein [Geomonas]MBU5636572.1 hypothetical protein [Geomonas diazotrophica]QWV98629.1 hypothetical protein KP005_04890 [Geomonas nitrogeniifigens]QXE87805.1 hypothetical protein KP003_05210 [Geomonas nitrogeniifigens]
MEFKNGLGDTAIQNVIANHPEIGEILNRYEIGCVTCKVGICLLKDVVSIHGLTPEQETAVEKEINDYLDAKEENRRVA